MHCTSPPNICFFTRLYLLQSLKVFKRYLSKFKFRAKFYPEDVEQELFEDITIRYFYLQVRALILQDTVYCPPDTCVLLASYALQERYGNYSAEKVESEGISKRNLLPER